jgi:hypothetical protein
VKTWTKKVPPKQPAPLSFVELVTKYGDDWASALPIRVKAGDPFTHDFLEAAHMRLMERGIVSRIAPSIEFSTEEA